MSSHIASQAMHFMLQVVQMSYIYYFVTKISYKQLQSNRGLCKRRVALMKRVMVLVTTVGNGCVR